MDASRAPLLRRGFRLELFTIIYNVLEGLVGITAGVVAGSVALIGFGVDSFVEVTSAVVVGWRLYAEMRGQDACRAERVERRASRIAGVLLIALAGYLVADSTRRLLGWGGRPEESRVGIALTGISLVIMPLLGRVKLWVAKELGSRALRADAFETIACAWLSLTTLAGLILNAAAGWWWADPLAALVLVPLIVREGLEAMHGECGCTCE
jgi:cation diffusion facilitator family transporter